VSTLKEFCQLRNESVAGQLDGSIPSTSAGQKTDSASLVDASAITISDMGSMNNTMGGMGGGDFGGGMGGGDMGGGHGGRGGKGDHQTQQSEDGEMASTDVVSQATPTQDGGEMTATDIESQPAPTQNDGSAEPPAAPSGESGDGEQPKADDNAPTVMTTNEVEQQPQNRGGEEQPQTPTADSEATEPTTDGVEQQPQDGDNSDAQLPQNGDNGDGQQPQGGDQHQANQMQPGEQPGGMGQDSAAQNSAEMGILLGASLLVLLIGLAIVIKYKR
jgi:hypothetical protein